MAGVSVRTPSRGDPVSRGVESSSQSRDSREFRLAKPCKDLMAPAGEGFRRSHPFRSLLLFLHSAITLQRAECHAWGVEGLPP